MEIGKLKKEIGLVKAESLYRTVLFASILCIIASIIISSLMYLKTEKTIKDITSKVIVINNGTVVSGDVQEVNETDLIKLQCENVLRNGVDYMYSFTSLNYDERIKLARAYFGKSGDEILQTYLNGNVRDKIITNHLRVDVVIKKINIIINNNNVIGNIEFEQSFINGTAVNKRTINASCIFTKSQVSSKNGYGWLIENWIING